MDRPLPSSVMEPANLNYVLGLSQSLQLGSSAFRVEVVALNVQRSSICSSTPVLFLRHGLPNVQRLKALGSYHHQHLVTSCVDGKTVDQREIAKLHALLLCGTVGVWVVKYLSKLSQGSTSTSSKVAKDDLQAFEMPSG